VTGSAPTELGSAGPRATGRGLEFEATSSGPRRLRTLRQLASRVGASRTAEEAFRSAIGSLASTPEALPFALLYLVDADGQRARLVGSSGVEPGESVSPPAVALEASSTWPLGEALRVGASVLVDDLPTRFAPWGGHDATTTDVLPTTALVVPIVAPGEGTACGLLVAGLPPDQSDDEARRDYLELVSNQIGAGIAGARAQDAARLRAEALLRDSEEARARAARVEDELRHTIAVRDAFISAASHELRTPLTTLELQLDGLLRAMASSPDPSTARWLSKAEKLRAQTHRLDDLIEGMLDVFGFTAERPQLRPQDLDLADVAREVVDRLRRESKQAHAAVELQARPARGHWDRERLDQVVTHLLANALKFGDGRAVKVVVESGADLARLTVADRGIGIAKEDHERIFGRFERAASANHYGGFGLGLWIVRELVQAMGGSVRVESRPEDGATFVVELPRRQ
jgi:signal transduction histidine kinase